MDPSHLGAMYVAARRKEAEQKLAGKLLAETDKLIEEAVLGPFAKPAAPAGQTDPAAPNPQH